MSILLDLISFVPTCFFLNVLNSKNIFLIIIYGLVIDFIVAETKGLVMVLLVILFFVTRHIKNYYLANLISFVLFLFFFSFFYDISIYQFLISFSFQFIFIILNRHHTIKW